MAYDANKKKREQLNQNPTQAGYRLRKSLLFKYVSICNDNICYRCGLEIKDIDDFTIEHKIPYLDSEDPVKLFFDLDNIAFSHLKCNSKASRGNIKYPECGTIAKYRKKCRCVKCKNANKEYKRNQRFKEKVLW